MPLLGQLLLFLSSVDLVGTCLTITTATQCDPFLLVDLAGIFLTISELKPLMINAICFIDLHSWIFQSFKASTFSDHLLDALLCKLHMYLLCINLPYHSSMIYLL